MALNNFSTEKHAVNINGRTIEDWGQSDPPYTDDPIDQPSQLIRGQGGGAVRFDRLNPGRRVTLNLMPGSPDSAYLSGLYNSKANITLGRVQIGTLEAATGTEGVIVNKNQTGRGGASLSDDQYVVEFNGWTETSGGE